MEDKEHDKSVKVHDCIIIIILVHISYNTKTVGSRIECELNGILSCRV